MPRSHPLHRLLRFFYAMLKPLGIEKGKPFRPVAAKGKSPTLRTSACTT
jgi:hypothetical protein